MIAIHQHYVVQLASLVACGDFDAAGELCERALEEGLDPLFWKTQLGYASFLNEGNIEAHYEIAPQVFSELTQTFALDSNAWFWSGYMHEVVLGQTEDSRSALRRAITLAPRLQYPYLVLSGIEGNTDRRAAIQLLGVVIRLQPDNCRALRDLLKNYEALEEQEQALATARLLIERAPFVETNYGIMNSYVNDVLTGATHADNWKIEARRQWLPA